MFTAGRSARAVRPPGAIDDQALQASAAAHHVRAHYFIAVSDRDRLVQIAALVDEGKLKPVVATVYPLAEARLAYERGRTGHRRGKIVLPVIPAAWTGPSG
ncbi:MAG TPA: zinc-binding dehydrogenase [Aggregatilineaceae bacterium]|nr:zinc-binding dehydrogenase [Aggregatilineaceae bacterium]